jgi:hypothetical protein
MSLAYVVFSHAGLVCNDDDGVGGGVVIVIISLSRIFVVADIANTLKMRTYIFPVTVCNINHFL